MATYVISPGAWLAGSGLHPNLRVPAATDAGWHPNLQPRAAMDAGWHPNLIVPAATDAGWHPNLRFAAGTDAATHPNLSPAQTTVRAAAESMLAAGQLWRGTDPAWVYQGGSRALLAQALERTYSRIVRPTDPRLPPQKNGVMRVAANAVGAMDPLWRWGSEFRVHAVVADLAWRLRVEKRELKLTAGGALSLSLALDMPEGQFTEDQIDKVQRAAIEREDRLPEILAQSDDLLSFFRVVLGIDSTASPILAEVLAVAWQWATPLVMALKNDVAALRPVQRAPSVMPVIATPAHGALPSGHATMSVLTSEILAALLFDSDPKHPRVLQMDRLVRRMAFNRVVAGVHFPVDSAAGYALGLQLAGHFVGWATGKPAFAKFSFDPENYPELTETGKRPQPTPRTKPDGRSAPLALMWNAAQREAERGGP